MTPERRAEIEAMLDALIPGDREIIRADRDKYPSWPMDEITTYNYQIGYITWWEDHPEWSEAEARFAAVSPGIVRELLAEIDLLTHQNNRFSDADDYDPLARDRRYWTYLQRLYELAAERDGFVGTPEQIKQRYQVGTLTMHEARSGVSPKELAALRDECGWFPTPRDIEVLYG